MAKIGTYSSATPADADLLLGTDAGSADATKNFQVSAIGAWARDFLISDTVPATAGAAGTKGQIAFESGWVYVCIATNTWQRAAIATW